MDSIKFLYTGFTGLTGFFSPPARSPFGRRPFYPDDPVDPVQFSFKDENPFLFLSYFNLRFLKFLFRLDWPPSRYKAGKLFWQGGAEPCMPFVARRAKKGTQELFYGLRIPSFCIRARNVPRLSPKISAAPFLPLTFHSVRSST